MLDLVQCDTWIQVGDETVWITFRGGQETAFPICPVSDPERVNILRTKFHMDRVLLVDDEILGTTSRAEVLRESGYSVDFYPSPLAALWVTLLCLECSDGTQYSVTRARGAGRFHPIVISGIWIESLNTHTENHFVM